MTGLRQRPRGRGRSVSSTRWLARQLNDPYVHKARREGYRSRSAYKLLEIDRRHGILRRGGRIVDLGCAPGGWTQVATRKGAKVVGIDLLPVEPIQGAELIQGDFLDSEVQDRLVAVLGGPADVVLSDLAASATGQRAVDRLRAEAIGEAVIAFAQRVLGPGGDLLIKLVRGAEARLQDEARPLFKSVRLLRPPATRKESSEIFLLARGFRGGDG